MRILLTLAYDGRHYAGWQSQANSTAIQDLVEAAVQKIAKLPSPPTLHSAGRTDAGVHALAQTAHFDVPKGSKLTTEAWLRALNANLPPEIRVRHCREVPARFHARFDAVGKTYRYRVVTSPILLPQAYGQAAHFPKPLDMDLLEKAAKCCQGRHDFAAFAATRGEHAKEAQPGYAVRTISRVEVEHGEEEFFVTFHGEGFLYKMVRLLTGAILRVAAGKNTLQWLQDHLHQPAGRRTAFVAPAEGLTLVEVHYPAPFPPTPIPKH